MATQPILDMSADQTGTDIATIVAHNPVIVLVDAGKRDDLYAHIRREVEAFTPDLTTKKGRDAIKSLAFKITRTKTAIDGAGKALNEEARAKINVVDAARRDARDTLERMAAEVRKPLDDWEDAEEARVNECREDIAAFKRAGVVTLEDTAASVRERGADLWNQAIDPERFQDLTDEAEAAKATSVDALKAALARLTKEEADRAELEKLRAEAAERERVEAEKAEAARVEAEIKAAQEFAARDAERRAREEAERIAAAEKAAEDRARAAAEQAAEAERNRVQREHEAALAAERAKAAEAERLREAEADRIAEVERQRAAAEAAARAEQERREKNRQHVAKIMGEAKAAIMSCGVTEEVAKAIVLAIKANTIPHVGITF